MENEFMRIAIQEAKKALDKNEVPVGAVIVKEGKVIAKAHNLKESKKNVLKHAELICIEKASKKLNNWRLSDCIIYITMFPCIMCADAIKQSRIKKVIYGTKTNDNDLFNFSFDVLNNTTINSKVDVELSIVSNECSLLVKEFFERKRIEETQ